MLPCFRRSLVFSLWYTEHKESWIRPDQTHPHSPEPRTPQPSAYHPCLLQGTRHDLRVCELSWQPLRSSLFIVGWTAPQSRSIVGSCLGDRYSDPLRSSCTTCTNGFSSIIHRP